MTINSMNEATMPSTWTTLPLRPALVAVGLGEERVLSMRTDEFRKPGGPHAQKGQEKAGDEDLGPGETGGLHDQGEVHRSGDHRTEST
jgi:hypothetical protein